MRRRKRKDLVHLANKGPLEKKSGGVLGAIERIGNALPSPFILFLWLVVILVALTTVLAALGVSAVNPTTQEAVTVQSLLTRDGLVWILGSLVSNFSGFAALGIVLVMQMTIGVTEEAAQMIDPSYTTTPANNWYFMIASCFVLTKEYLGVCPPDDTQGVLQDMHWAGDYIGYFQSYALGNIYDGQILEALERDMPAWQEEIRQGNFAPPNGWMGEHIWQWGCCFTAGELVQRVTGSALDAKPFLRYLDRKYSALYGLAPEPENAR